MLIVLHDAGQGTPSMKQASAGGPAVVFCMDCRRVRLTSGMFVPLPSVLEALGEHASSTFCPACAELRGVTPQMVAQTMACAV